MPLFASAVVSCRCDSRSRAINSLCVLRERASAAATQPVYQLGCHYGAVGVGLARTQFLLAESVDLPIEMCFYAKWRRAPQRRSMS